MPIRKSEPAYSTSVAVEDFPTLGMHQMEASPIGKFWNNATTPIDLTGGGAVNPSLNAAYLTINYAGTGTVKMTGGSSSAAFGLDLDR